MTSLASLANCTTHWSPWQACLMLTSFRGLAVGLRNITSSVSHKFSFLGVIKMKNRLYYPNMSKQTKNSAIINSSHLGPVEFNWLIGNAYWHVSSSECVAACGSGSNAACCVGIWKYKEGQRVSGKIQMSSGRLVASFKFRECFVIHHLQHFSVKFGGPSSRHRGSADGEMTDKSKVLKGSNFTTIVSTKTDTLQNLIFPHLLQHKAFLIVTVGLHRVS